MWLQDLANLHPDSFINIHAALSNVCSWKCVTDISWRSSCAVRRNLLPLSAGKVMEAARSGNYRAKPCRIYIWELVILWGCSYLKTVWMNRRMTNWKGLKRSGLVIWGTVPKFAKGTGANIEALRYKPVGRGFDSRLCYWNFSLK
jgi:hypothetical protein